MMVIKIVGSASEIYTEFDGEYICDFFPDTDALGLGTLITTDNKAKAKQFPNLEAATEFWKQRSKRVPLRPDGKPNRPLTAFSITFERVE
jgi:hypothetical protein